jgi:hypothetical protein
MLRAWQPRATLAVALALAACGGHARAPNPAAQPYSKRSTAPGEVARVTPADYRRPIAGYKRYVRRQLGALLGEVAGLRAAIARRDLAGARSAWLRADARYESIGAAYGAFGDLDAAVNGRPAGLPGGVRSPTSPAFIASSSRCGSTARRARPPAPPSGWRVPWRACARTWPR